MRTRSSPMKRILFIALGSAMMVPFGAGAAFADAGPHKSTAVGAGLSATMQVAGGSRCASCHRAHTAKAENLLKQAQPALCYSCHSSLGSALDVVDGIETTGSTEALRGGGFEFALIDGAGANKTMGTVAGAHGLPVASESVPVLQTTPVKVTSAHQIDGVTTGTMWGNGAISDAVDAGKPGVKLECGSCHDPHGNGNYRILRPVPNDSGLPNTADATGALTVAPVGVNIPDAITKVYTTTNYWSVADRNVPTVKAAPGVPPVAPLAGATDGFITNVAAWCTTCHTRYYAPSGSAGVDSGDAVLTYRHASSRSDKDGVSRPNCIQCHVSHGSNVSMTSRAAAVPLPGQVGTNPDGTLASSDPGYGDSKLLRVDNRGTCVMCHNV
jgi:predicted CXXCH cytochrome family protein